MLEEKTPPVSDLYWRNKPQDGLSITGEPDERSHIRWWNAGLDHENRPKWLGAISYDDGLRNDPVFW
ncbi:LssY C-terminal domain-containing protein [Vibrio lentus]|nr:LssY C-terminal domain-containing protein [Vibrio lentus]